jgi:hypothetical protein
MEAGLREYGPDWESIMASEAQGTMKCLVARQGSAMIGYLGWSIGFDMESKGALIAHQLSWYVLPGHHAVAARMLDWLIVECKRLGVKFLYLSHPERGRGKSLGRFFARRGAMHTSNIYTLPLWPQH